MEIQIYPWTTITRTLWSGSL